MNDPLTISLTGLHSTEAATLRRAIDIVLRNTEVRAKYRELRGRGITAGEAKAVLASSYNLATDTIHSILWPS